MRGKRRGRGTMEEQMVVFCTVQYSTVQLCPGLYTAQKCFKIVMLLMTENVCTSHHITSHQIISSLMCPCHFILLLILFHFVKLRSSLYE